MLFRSYELAMLLLQQRFSSLLSGLAVLAFLVKSLIPLGFMPALSGADGKVFPLVICTSAGPSTVYLPADKLPGDVQHKADKAGPCPFASLTKGVAVPPVFALACIFSCAFSPAFHVSSAVPASAVFKNYVSQAPPA